MCKEFDAAALDAACSMRASVAIVAARHPVCNEGAQNHGTHQIKGLGEW